MKQRIIISLASAVAAVISNYALADHDEQEVSSNTIEEVYVTGGAQAIRSLAGSASFIDSEALKAFDSTDLNDVLGQVPGVYIRFEDGYGLRPNIGIRGATSDRSQKITLMEDGILIGPSPYAAPAAYYIPNVNRMDAVEVFKGPAAIEYGPHTVGGALNMVTRIIPDARTGEISATLGNDAYQKYRLFYGDNKDLKNSELGFWVDGLHYGADGFKELDGQNTGFTRNDLNAKMQWQSKSEIRPQTLVVKLGYADEDSNETYLGLSDDDFALNPVQRYAASAEDQFVSEHTQLHAIHTIDWTENFNVTSRAYVNRFERDWTKFDGFAEPIDGCPLDPNGEPLDCTPDIQDVLANPDIYIREMQLLRGERDSVYDYEYIDVTSNDRSYGSQGVEFTGEYNWVSGAFEHTSTMGLRYHEDYVERDHQAFAYAMVGGDLQLDDQPRDKKTLNKSEADALAVYLNHETQWQDLKLNAGIRVESIDSQVTDFLEEDADLAVSERSDTVVIPGLGAFYQLNERFGLLAGINKGFSPAVAGSGAEPEESVNYEYGFRYSSNGLTADVIGFYSDYSNLIGRCRVSDPECDGGTQEFNGGEADIAGFELTSDYMLEFSNGLGIPLSLVYTYTDATFATSFDSGFSQWGSVLEGDELPYTPAQQAKFGTGLEASQWSLKVTGKFSSRMREIPGQGEYVDGAYTPSHWLWDVAARYMPNDEWDFLLAVENIFDKQVIVSRRPFGARPNQPLSVKAGVTYSF